MTDNNTFTATVTYWNSEKKFGFAERGSQRIFIHLSACREVEGTPEEPKLTNRVAEHEPTWFRGCRLQQDLIVRTVSSPKGLKAIAWGFVPKRTWLENLQHFGTLSTFAGGHVEIGYSQHPRGRYDRRSQGKLTTTPQLVPGDPWVLHLSYDTYDGPVRTYGECTGQKELAFLLDEARPERGVPYGRYALNVYIPTTDEWAHIALYPPGQWVGN